MTRRPVLALLVSSIASAFLQRGVVAFKGGLRSLYPPRVTPITAHTNIQGRRRQLYSMTPGEGEDPRAADPVPSKTRRRRTRGSSDEQSAAKADADAADVKVVVPRKRSRTTSTEPSPKGALKDTGSASPAAKPKKERATIPRGQTRDPVRQPVLPPGRKELKIVSWNVAGLRGVLKRPEAVASTVEWIQRERPHVLCLQETKLQECHVEEVGAVLKGLLPSYQTAYWSCSTAKKGYSGTVILISDEAATSASVVQHGIGQPEGDAEGRVLTVDLGVLYLTAVYTPNSGEALKRLDYRTNVWDRVFQEHLKKLGEEKPVVVCGDLNVAHQNIDFFNPEEPRMKKAAGTTPEERESFSRLLEETGLVDTFRWRHGEVTGVYSYWSVRAGNRPYNRGLRLDYTLCSKELVHADEETFPRLLDAFILDQEIGLHGRTTGLPSYTEISRVDRRQKESHLTL